MNAVCYVGPVVRELGVVEAAAVRVDGGKIVSVTTSPPSNVEIVDCGADLIAPGLIDLQLNGAFGLDFTVAPETVAAVAARLPQYGVTAFLPTLITSPLETYPTRLQTIAQVRSQGATILGVHLEGPFLSYGKRGAHNPAHLRPPRVEDLAPLLDAGNVRLMTLAPELPGAAAMAAYLRAHGVVVSIGHTEASYDQAVAALDAGAGWGTHLFNAMPTLGHRQPGPVAALLERSLPPVGLIVDGIHVHPAMVRLVWRCKGVSGITLVSDAMAALGMAPGVYQLSDQTVHVDAVSARLADGTLAGSILSVDQALRNIVAYTGCTPGQAVWMASATAADALGLRHKGRLEEGYDADIVMLTPDLHVRRTLVGGRVVYTT